ncbi:uncharacterized protein LOC115215561 [Octopus sinensis]|uniref:Uncharacterized protein LOC115215561 n=1 Tax=Octopus sinensis TaxID=2607531 RepID=A0A7E6ESH6_9MOLL|nr:uncharacterized protein LOC115215561 [Octopus sinensis]
MPCAPGTMWSQSAYTCIADNNNVNTQHTDSTTDKTTTTNKSTINNPCTKENIDAGKFYFAHPNKKFFIQCNKWGTYFVMPCAPGTMWSQSAYTCIADDNNVNNNNVSTQHTKAKTDKTTTTIKSTINNPCTNENSDAGKFYFAHPNKNFFIQCNKWGTYFVMPCAPGTIWSQNTYTCIAVDSNVNTQHTDSTTDKTTTTNNSTINNPCTKENIDAGKFYFAHPNKKFFIQCNEWSTYFVIPCAPGTMWSQSAYTCIADDSNVNNNVNTQHTDSTTDKTTTTTKSTINNPCTKENSDAGKFYFAHPNKKFFIQCNQWGTYFVMPCAPGTMWSQSAYTCIADDSNVNNNNVSNQQTIATTGGNPEHHQIHH